VALSAAVAHRVRSHSFGAGLRSEMFDFRQMNAC